MIEEAPEIEWLRHSEKPGYLIVTVRTNIQTITFSGREYSDTFVKQADKEVNLGNMSFTLLMGRSHLDPST